MAYDRDLRTVGDLTNQDAPGAEMAQAHSAHARKRVTRRVVVLIASLAAAVTFVFLSLVVFHKPVAIAIAGFLVAHMLLHFGGGHSHGGGHSGDRQA